MPVIQQPSGQRTTISSHSVFLKRIAQFFRRISQEEKPMKNCQEIMTKNPECCLASDKVYAIAQRMQSENVGALPVVENHQTKKLIGIVTDRDLAVRVVAASRDATNTQAGDVMTPNPLSCHPFDDLDATLEVMARQQIRRIPVVDENGQVVGIIAQADVAIRLDNHDKAGQIIGQISQPDLVSAR
jgi:CBS domain-containing protein